MPSPEHPDHLGQSGVLRTLVSTIERMPAGGCIALYGPWGSGKTALMRNAMRCLDAGKLSDGTERARGKHLTLWFDPWEYERADDVLTPLLRRIVKVAEAEVGTEGDRAARFWSAAGAVLKTGLALGARIGLRWLAGVGADALNTGEDGAVDAEAAKGSALHALDKVTEKDLTQYFKAWTQRDDAIESIKAEFAKLTTLALNDADAKVKTGRKLVVFLDDLDRCLPERVVHLIEAVKLLLCSRKAPIVFVFGLDRGVVGEAIRQQYPGATAYTGENYLEKIFDQPLEAPPIGEAGLGEFVLGVLGTWASGQSLTGRPPDIASLVSPFRWPEEGYQAHMGAQQLLVDVLAQPHFGNPRVIKRALNRLLILADSSVGEWLLRQPNEKGPSEYPLYPHTKKQKYGPALLAWLVGLERFRALRMHVGASGKDGRSDLIALRDSKPHQHFAAYDSLRRLPGIRPFILQLDSVLDSAETFGLLLNFDLELRRVGL